MHRLQRFGLDPFRRRPKLNWAQTQPLPVTQASSAFAVRLVSSTRPSHPHPQAHCPCTVRIGCATRKPLRRPLPLPHWTLLCVCARASSSTPTSIVDDKNLSHRPSRRYQDDHNRRLYKPRHHYLSLAFYLAPLYVTAACLAFIYYESTFHDELLQSEDDEEFNAMEVPPGRPGNLTPEQDEKLRQLWAAIFKLCNVASEEELAAAMADASLVSSPTAVTPKSTFGPDGSAEKDKEKPKKKRLGIFNRSSKASSSKDAVAEDTKVLSPTPMKAGESTTGTTGTPTVTTPSGKTTPLPLGADIEDKYGQTKHFLETLEKQTPESIRSTIWSMVKHDNPDALMLRFLRARKWDVDRALVMLISTMNWRHEQMKVDEVIMKEGELHAAGLEASDETQPATRTLMRDFMAQIRMGKSFLHGVDRHGRPICVVRVRYHRAGEQCEESLERYTVYLIETARMVLRSPIDTATIVFDMTNFSMANMDYTPLKFMIKCFEANYPESLGAVLVHKAPWVFQGIWKIIRGWLDPVVASKVHFTNNAKDVEEFIPPEHVLKELDGQEDWTYQYIEPVPGENDTMKDTATRDALLKRREEQAKEYEQLTMKWIKTPEDEALIKTRNEAAESLRKGYWELDPYLRARSLYDRMGVLKEGGKVEFYPEEEEKKAEREKEKPNGDAGKGGGDDDVD